MYKEKWVNSKRNGNKNKVQRSFKSAHTRVASTLPAVHFFSKHTHLVTPGRAKKKIYRFEFDMYAYMCKCIEYEWERVSAPFLLQIVFNMYYRTRLTLIITFFCRTANYYYYSHRSIYVPCTYVKSVEETDFWAQIHLVNWQNKNENQPDRMYAHIKKKWVFAYMICAEKLCEYTFFLCVVLLYSRWWKSAY